MNATEIIPGLWQSGWPNDPAWFAAHGVRQVVNLVPDAQGLGYWGSAVPRYPDGTDVHRWHFLDIPGSVPPPGWIDEVSACVVDCLGRGPVLVHCSAGNNRSTVAVASALCRLNGWSGAEALAAVRAKRDVRPAPEWVAALAAWSVPEPNGGIA